MLTWITIYAVIKYWVPVVAGFGLVIKAYNAMKTGILNVRAEIGQWADALLNNHLSHIQSATEQTANTLVQMQKDDRVVVAAITQVATDLKHHQDDDLRVQSAMLTDLAVIKAKV